MYSGEGKAELGRESAASGEFPYKLKEGENPFWCAVVDGFNP